VTIGNAKAIALFANKDIMTLSVQVKAIPILSQVCSQAYAALRTYAILNLHLANSIIPFDDF
jgi:hypothetical protein